MEHVERQEEREAELRAKADDLEDQANDLEKDRERLEGRIGEVREEFERKKESSEVPGAQEEGGSPTGSPPGDAAGGAPRTEEDE